MLKSHQPRKQRKAFFNAPLHKKNKSVVAHLSMNLSSKYNKRNFPVIKGDRVEVMRGKYKGYKNEVSKVDVKYSSLIIEGATSSKVDGTIVARSIHCSNVRILKLNLSDPWRRRKLVEKLSPEKRAEIEEEVKKEQEAREKEAEEVKEERIREKEELEEKEEKIREEGEKNG
jgi:large subunit ribosomal protein L24